MERLASALTCALQQIERLELRDLEQAIMSLSEEQRTAVLLVALTRGSRVGWRCAGQHDPVSAFARPCGLAQAHGNCRSTASSRVDALLTRGASDNASREKPCC
jgi:hypothetical protein